MKQKLNLSDLISFLKTENLKLTENQINNLAIYHEELILWSRRINLISKGDTDHIVERHFLPSFYYLKYLINAHLKAEASLLDIGSGAGFPGVILSNYLKNNLTLLDASRKKTLFLKNIKNKLDGDQNIICTRAEEEAFIKEQSFDVVTARAVAPISKLTELVWPIMCQNGYLLTLKGDGYKSEIKGNLQASIKITELKPIPEWVEFSNHLQNKIMLKLEKNNV